MEDMVYIVIGWRHGEAEILDVASTLALARTIAVDPRTEQHWKPWEQTGHDEWTRSLTEKAYNGFQTGPHAIQIIGKPIRKTSPEIP